MAKEKVSLTIDKELWKEFHKHCNGHAFNLSGKVELLIREELTKSKKKDIAYSRVISILNSIVRKKARPKLKQEKKKPVKEQLPSLEFLRERMLEKRKAFSKKKRV